MSKPIRVFMPCTGLGRQQRGFEAFAREAAAKLSAEPELSIRVFAGGPSALDEVYVRNFPRTGLAARWLARLVRRSPYFVEQASFFLGLVPYLEWDPPDLVYFLDANLGSLCWHWRRFRGGRFRLLMCNGGQITKPFTRCDLVQQVAQPHYESALSRGELAARQIVVPHALSLSHRVLGDRLASRRRQQLPLTRPIVLSVGAISASEKRMDYVVREVAALPQPRPYLVLVGQQTDQTAAIVQLANERLGADNWTLRTVGREEVWDFYAAADVFVLASPGEGFGLVNVEALASGLPVLSHDYPVARWVLGPHGQFADMSRPGELVTLLARELSAPPSAEMAQERRRYAIGRYSWESLSSHYVSMFRHCMTMPISSNLA